MEKDLVFVGRKVRFDPFATSVGFGIEDVRGEVEGTVVAIYGDHKWFSVEYGNSKQRTSFNFADIGKTVMLGG